MSLASPRLLSSTNSLSASSPVAVAPPVLLDGNNNNTTTTATASSKSTDISPSSATAPPPPTDDNAAKEATLSTLLEAYTSSASPKFMDRGPPAISTTTSGLHTPYPNAFLDASSEQSSADHASAPFPARPSTTTTPTSEYGYPHSTRAEAAGASYPEHLQRPFHPASIRSGEMAQPTSPSMPPQEGRSAQTNPQAKSDTETPIDPSIAASSPSYPPHSANTQYSPYPPQQDMQHGYPGHPQSAMYAQPRPDWSGYGHPGHGMPGYAVSGANTPTSAASAPGGRPGQVYSFVPIPGAQQHKRPRRRYEEIERMYKCGWNGCEKAYGTLNHLNAHVTMQSHGQKRTPEEFKEIRKEWKARKKEEENARKAEEDRARQNGGAVDGQPSEGAPPGYPQGRSVQLPPIGYQPGAQVPGQYQPASAGGNVSQLQEYGGGNYNHLQNSGGYPASPYGAPDNGNGPSAAPKYEH